MKTCMACGRKSGDDQAVCPHCSARLPTRADALPETVAQIDFLLGQVDDWLAAGSITPEQARKLRDDYLDRKDRLTSIQPLHISHPPSSHAPPPQAKPLPTPAAAGATNDRPVVQVAPVRAYEPPEGIGSNALSYLQAVGVALLFAGLVGSVAFAWRHSGMEAVVAVLVMLTIAAAASLRFPAIDDNPITRNTVTVVALLMVPLEVAGGMHLARVASAITIGLSASIASLATSALAQRWRNCGAVTAVLSASLAALCGFALSLLIPRFVHSHGDHLYRDFGPPVMGLALAYFLTSRLIREGSNRRIWMLSGHAVAAIAVVIAWWTWAPGAGLGAATLTLAIGAAAYVTAAIVFGIPAYANAAVVMALAAANMTVAWRGGSWSSWYYYAVATDLVALTTMWASSFAGRLGRDDFNQSLTKLTYIAAALGVIPQVCVILGCAFALSDIRLETIHVVGALVAAALTLIVMRPVARPALTAVWIGYIGILCEFLVACLVPKSVFLHTQPHIGIALAVTAAVFLWGLKQPTEARWCSIIALTATVIYALVGGFVPSSLLALGIIIVVTIVDAVIVTRNRRGAFDQFDAVIGAVALTVLVLLYEAKFLPYMHLLKHWDNNAGYGLGPLALAFAGLSVWFRRENRLLGQAMRTASMVVVGLVVLLEYSYTLHDGMIRSPLLVLEWGILACGIVAAFGKSDFAAWVVLGLTAATALLFGLGPHAWYSPRETALVWSLLGVATLYAVLSARARRLSWTYCAALFLLVALLGFVHRYTGALIAAYPVIAALYAAGLIAVALGLRERDTAEVWCTPMATIAITVAYVCIAPLLSAFAQAPTPLEFKLDVVGFLLVTLLFAEFAYLYRSEVYVVVTGLALSGLTLLVLRHAEPHAALTKLSVDLGYASLVLVAAGWIGISAVSAKPAIRFLPAGLTKAAMAVAVAAAILAAFGLGSGPERYGFYSAVVLGIVLLASGTALQNAAAEFIGKGVFGLTYFLYIVVRIQHPGVPLSDYYLTGVGVFTLTVATFAGPGKPRSVSAALVAGSLLIVGPPLAAIMAPHSAFALAPVIAVLCVIFVYWGLMTRLWGITAVGTAALAALIALAAAGHTPRIHWAVFATLLGIVVIASATILERRNKTRVAVSADAPPG